MNLEKLTKNLENKGYEVKVFSNVKEANAYLEDSIKGKTIGFGGSITLQETGLYDVLSKNNKVYWHWKDSSLQDAYNTEVYFSSVNGMDEEGQIINIDGTGNRVAATLYGHETVYFVLGINKIRDTYKEALDRARNIASVKNAIRLNKDVPCVKLGKCIDCKSKNRICRGLTVLWEKPSGSKYQIIIIKENLGY